MIVRDAELGLLDGAAALPSVTSRWAPRASAGAPSAMPPLGPGDDRPGRRRWLPDVELRAIPTAPAPLVW